MLTTLRQRINRDEEGGFTLIELMVVVLIIGILLAIAIPTFLGAREKAQNRSAQSNLRNALTAEKVYFVDNQLYSNNTETPPAITAIEPSLTFVNTMTPGSAVGTVYVEVTGGTSPNGTEVWLSAKSASGTCWYIHNTVQGPVQYGKAAGCGAADVAGNVAYQSTGFSS